MKKIIFRADDYSQNMGDLIGFFETKLEAESEIEFSKPTDDGNGTFSQITEFEVDSDRLKGVDLSDNDTMLHETIWGSGEIVNTYYYK